MEYVLLVIVILQSIAMTYLLVRNKPIPKLTEEEVERQRKERIEKDWQKLFNYNETIATRGYKE